MKIGIDARLWNESGVGRYTRNLVLELSKIDKKNDYVLFAREEDESGIRNYELGDRWKIVPANIRWHTLAEQVQFPSILNKEHLDLVHFPYFSVPVLYNRSFVVTIHDLILHHFPTGEASTLPFPVYSAKLFGYKNIIRLAAKRAKKIITVSHSTENEIIKTLHVPQNKITVTYEGIDTSLVKEGKLKEAINDPYFLYVGNAYPHKNLHTLLTAFFSLKNQLSTTKLYLVGGEDYFYRRLQQKVESMEISKAVVFFGKASDVELAFLYKHAQALIMPSLMEGFGLPVVEAMANECLVIASDIPAHREIAGESAIYFDPKNAADLGEKITSVNLKDRKLFSAKRKKGIEQTKNFSWPEMARKTLQVYETALL